jgi:hypothetical protein
MALPTPAELRAAARRQVVARNNRHRDRVIHTPTNKTRRLVWCMASAGMDELAISKAFGISPRQLSKVYHSELDYGMGAASARVVATLFEIATDKGHPQCVTAAKFWLNAKGGWTEKTESKISSKLEALRFSDDEQLIAIARRGLEGIRETESPGGLN